MKTKNQELGKEVKVLQMCIRDQGGLIDKELTSKSILDLDTKIDVAVFVDVGEVRDNTLINRLTAQSAAIMNQIRAGKFGEGDKISYKQGGRL
ncbi:hypothetical protein HHI36_001332 [Cryptolaemus montrouzieri]|uniref:Uncharacterized protein n=1 Tax=Cryptolaemus montrouzieri TaxID=559131 RepID=A0ABD2P829_9CUCU